jgi:hypothetical protein
LGAQVDVTSREIAKSIGECVSEFRAVELSVFVSLPSSCYHVTEGRRTVRVVRFAMNVVM